MDWLLAILALGTMAAVLDAVDAWGKPACTTCGAKALDPVEMTCNTCHTPARAGNGWAVPPHAMCGRCGHRWTFTIRRGQAVQDVACPECTLEAWRAFIDGRETHYAATRLEAMATERARCVALVERWGSEFEAAAAMATRRHEHHAQRGHEERAMVCWQRADALRAGEG